ncbi:cytochrome b [Agaribacter flavus]|uniref:Cytochrome b n=1 Tax=Agaribacter flavus TaxID=1902781 RepID=A0ABV7FSJ5_9ALTE
MSTRYHSVAIVIHWLMAVSVLVMIGTGLYMVNIDMPKAEQFKLYQYHKAGGVVMLWLIVLRLVVRTSTKRPALPSSLSRKNQSLAQIGHGALYSLLILIPLSGWFMVSASPFGLPTFVFVDWIKWPHIGFASKNNTVEAISNTVHYILAYLLFFAVAGHVAATIYHYKIHRINLFQRMWLNTKGK